jgi:hypothetical protein
VGPLVRFDEPMRLAARISRCIRCTTRKDLHWLCDNFLITRTAGGHAFPQGSWNWVEINVVPHSG